MQRSLKWGRKYPFTRLATILSSGGVWTKRFIFLGPWLLARKSSEGSELCLSTRYAERCLPHLDSAVQANHICTQEYLQSMQGWSRIRLKNLQGLDMTIPVELRANADIWEEKNALREHLWNYPPLWMETHLNRQKPKSVPQIRDPSWKYPSIVWHSFDRDCFSLSSTWGIKASTP